MPKTRRQSSSTTKKAGGRKRKWRWIAAVVLAILLLASLQWLPVGRWVETLQQWIEGFGAWGPVLFIAIYVLACLAFVPGSALTLAAGALFGLGWGMLLVSFSSTTVAALAFLIARHFAHARLERLARSHPRFEAIRGAIGKDGWKLVLLLRLSPIVPFDLANYLFGLTRAKFWPYVGASWLGMLPGTFLYVYLGHLGAEGARGRGKSPWEWALLGIGLAASIAAAIWIARASRRALDKRSVAQPAT